MTPFRATGSRLSPLEFRFALNSTHHEHRSLCSQRGVRSIIIHLDTRPSALRCIDHHLDGSFCGAITDPAFDDSTAVSLELSAGCISIHHARTIHGSTQNRSSAPRRLLLFQMVAIDAWPLMGVDDLAELNSCILRGAPTNQPRLADVPVRIPLPPAGSLGSIYESQTRFKDRKLV